MSRANATQMQTVAATALGNLLRKIREKNGWGVRELARRVDLAAGYVSNFESGIRHPSREVLGNILGLLGASIEEYNLAIDLYNHLDATSHLDPLYGKQTPAIWSYDDISAESVDWSPFRIPDELQTQAYAENTATFEKVCTNEELSYRLERRKIRADLLQRRTRPTYKFYIGSRALALDFLDPNEMRNQLLELLRLALILQHVKVFIVPEERWNPYSVDRFRISTSRYGQPREIQQSVTLQTTHAYISIGAKSEISRYNILMRRITAVALSIEESTSYIERQMDLPLSRFSTIV